MKRHGGPFNDLCILKYIHNRHRKIILNRNFGAAIGKLISDMTNVPTGVQ